MSAPDSVARPSWEAAVSWAGVGLALIAAPLLILPGWSFHYDVTPKVAVFALGVCLLAASPGSWWRGLRSISRDPVGRWFLLALALQAVSLSVSTAASSDQDLSLWGSSWRRFGFPIQLALIAFTVMLAAWLRSESERPRRLLALSALGGGLVSLYVVAQYFGLDPLIDPELYQFRPAGELMVRPPGTLGHAGYLATYLSSVVFWALAVALGASTDRLARIGSGAAGLAAFAILLSGTRSAFLGLAVGGVCLLAGMVRHGFGGMLRCRRTAVLAGLVVALAAGFYLSPGGERLRARISWAQIDVDGGARPLLWRQAAAMLAVRPVLGWGPETFQVVHPHYISTELARRDPDRSYESPHNVFADIAVAQGVIGLAAFVLFVAIGARAAIRSSGMAGAALAAALAAGLTSNLFLAFTLPTALYLYASIALVVAGGLRAEPSTNPAPPPMWVRTGLALAAIALVGIVLPLVVADYKLFRIGRQIAGGKLAAAVVAFEDLARNAPPGVRADFWFAQATSKALDAAADQQQALHAARVAVAAAQRACAEPETRVNGCMMLAALQSAGSDPTLIEKSLRAAIEASPRWYRPRWILARLLSDLGRDDEAREQIRKARELSADLYPQMLEDARRLGAP